MPEAAPKGKRPTAAQRREQARAWEEVARQVQAMGSAAPPALLAAVAAAQALTPPPGRKTGRPATPLAKAFAFAAAITNPDDHRVGVIFREDLIAIIEEHTGTSETTAKRALAQCQPGHLQKAGEAARRRLDLARSGLLSILGLDDADEGAAEGEAIAQRWLAEAGAAQDVEEKRISEQVKK